MSACLLPPDGFRPLAGGAAAARTLARKRPTRAGWPRITTRISTSSASCCPSGCTRISTTSTRICRWADDLGDEIGDTAESLRLLAWWRGELDAMYAGARRHPVFVALRGTVPKHGIPQRAVRRSDPRLRAGPDGHPLSRLGTSCSATAAIRRIRSGRLVLYLCGYSRRRAAAALRRDLHRAATGEFLAGRHRGSR